MSNEIAALQALAKTDIYHLRLTGLILSVLVERNLLNGQQARELIGDVRRALPAELAPFGEALSELQQEFPT